MRNSLTPARASLQHAASLVHCVPCRDSVWLCHLLLAILKHRPLSLLAGAMPHSCHLTSPDLQTFRASGNRGLHIPSHSVQLPETGRSIRHLPYTWTGGVCEHGKLSIPVYLAPGYRIALQPRLSLPLHASQPQLDHSQIQLSGFPLQLVASPSHKLIEFHRIPPHLPVIFELATSAVLN